MEERSVGYLLSSRAQNREGGSNKEGPATVSGAYAPKNITSETVPSHVNTVTDGSEDDKSAIAGNRPLHVQPVRTQENNLFNARKRSQAGMPEIDEDDLDDDSDSSEESIDSSYSSCAQHEALEDDEEVDDADVTFVGTKAMLLSRLQDSCRNGRLAMINLSRRSLTVHDAHLVSEAIVRNPLLSVLKLSYNELGDGGVTIIAPTLKQTGRHHENLTVVDLGFNGIGNIGCHALAVHCIAGNFSLRKLYLSGNFISRKGVASIAAAIDHGCGLHCLHLTMNEIGQKGLKTLVGAISKHDERAAAQMRVSSTPVPSMRELHVGNTGMNEDGFLVIPEMLSTNVSLRAISLSNCKIGDQGMVLLSHALASNKSMSLESLVLSFNQITCRGVESLMNAVWASSTLRNLKLDNNCVEDRGTQLCAVALTSIALEELDLSFNRQISTTGIKALMKNVSENNSLRFLSLAGVELDQNSSKAVSYALAYNTSLQTFYMDNCNVGYASQRHIVAGIVSNQLASLRLVTGFDLGPIAMTLGMPRLPEIWSNDQVLGFVRYMWQQWLLKSGRGRANASEVRGPAPPAAVAAASKIAFSSLGAAAGELFQTELHQKPPSQQPPMDRTADALLERTDSGTLYIPSFRAMKQAIRGEWTGDRVRETQVSNYSMVRTAMEDPERRNRNLLWLRNHFRALNDIGRLPFNNADLWQLHQFYFSPPYTNGDKRDAEPTYAAPSQPQASAESQKTGGDSKTPSRTISFQTLGDAASAAAEDVGAKRRGDGEQSANGKPAAKRSKSFRTRIAYYPRIMDKVQELGSKPMEHTLSLLRRLKYIENIMFADRNPYQDEERSYYHSSSKPSHADIEMVLLDLL